MVAAAAVPAADSDVMAMPGRCRDHHLTKGLHRSHRSRPFPTHLDPRRHRGPLASIREFDLEVHSGEARQSVGGVPPTAGRSALFG
jgi:hypothetical protein